MKNTFLFIETVTHFKETTSTEEGVDTIEEAEDYLNSLGYPKHVVEGAIKDSKYDDGAYIITITELETKTHGYNSQ